MALALIETNGAGELRGVWVSAAMGCRPAVAFVDVIDHQRALVKLDEAAGAVDAGDRTWDDFIEHIFQRQNHLTVERIAIATDLSAPSLLRDIEALWPNWDL